MSVAKVLLAAWRVCAPDMSWSSELKGGVEANAMQCRCTNVTHARLERSKVAAVVVRCSRLPETAAHCDPTSLVSTSSSVYCAST